MDSIGRGALCSGCSSRCWTLWKEFRRGSPRLRPSGVRMIFGRGGSEDRTGIFPGALTGFNAKKKIFSTCPAETRPTRRPLPSISLGPCHSETPPEMPKSRGRRPARRNGNGTRIRLDPVLSRSLALTCTSTVTSTPFRSIFSANSRTSSTNVSAPPKEIKVLG